MQLLKVLQDKLAQLSLDLMLPPDLKLHQASGLSPITKSKFLNQKLTLVMVKNLKLYQWYSWMRARRRETEREVQVKRQEIQSIPCTLFS